jgi:hypothetical protein
MMQHNARDAHVGRAVSNTLLSEEVLAELTIAYLAVAILI